MTIIYCFHPGDEDLALKNAQWMSFLGGGKNHQVFVLADKRCRLKEEIRMELNHCFGGVFFMVAGAEIDGWPEGANYFFRTACGYLQSRHLDYFMWMEPDAIPLKPGWLDALEREYEACGKKFMGDRVQVEKVPLHMSGVGIYPNPLHMYAGEAYRAHDVAWDMAGKDQIISQAHWTRLIEHAWKHPSFSDHHELVTQIRPEAMVFHSSKDGSLIDLLQGKQGRRNSLTAGRVQPPARPTEPKEPEEPGSPSLILDGDRERQSSGGALAQTDPTRPTARGDLSPSSLVPLTCDIFIRTYPKDYPWLEYCLKSIAKHCKGFRKVWVVSPSNPVWKPADKLIPCSIPIDWRVMNEEADDGYLSQQIHKLYADVITDYQADYILHLDSDVILTKEITPYTFFMNDGLVGWPYTPYACIQTPWQPITERFMGEEVEFEFMRRFPIMVPKWLYPRIREFCHKQHGRIISEYVRNCPERSFSEFNALGAFAYKYHHDRFSWWNTTEGTPAPVAKQFRSYDGITPEVKLELEKILTAVPVLANAGKPTEVISGEGEARESIAKTGGVAPDSRGGSQTPSIKVLPNDIWVLEGDQISDWVEEEGRLDHDQNLLPEILKYINEGDTVLDVGAFIGDHTIAYAEKVGAWGSVVAFEPNPFAYQCLKHNTEKLLNVKIVPSGTSDTYETVPLSGNNGNAGGSYVGEQQKIAEVRLQPLDLFNYVGVNFIKIDVEGYELKTLLGAKDLIARCHPVLVVEVNYEALKRQGARVGDLLALIETLGYHHRILQENCCLTSPLYDIVCTPEVALPGSARKSSPAKERDGLLAVVPSASPPVFNFKEAIAALEHFASQDPQNKAQVVRALSQAGLKPNPRNVKKKKK